MNAKILLIPLIVSLSGCSLFVDKPIEVVQEEVQRVQLNIPEPSPLVLNDLDWFVITPENQQEVFNEMSKRFDEALYGLSDEDYEDLSKNMILIRNYIMELRNILKEYKKYYE
jgi:hypothetical protein